MTATARRGRGNLIEAGVWAWGFVTVAMAASSLIFVLVSGFFLGADGQFLPSTPRLVAGLYHSLKDHGSLVAGILGFSGLAWAHFFAASAPPRRSN